MPLNRKKAEPNGHKDLAERVVQLATAISVVLGVPVAIVEGKPLSTVLVLAIALFCLGMWLLYLWRKHSASDGDEYKIQRLLTTGLAVAVTAGLTIVMAVPPSRSYFIYNLLGFQRSTSALSQDGLSAAESSTFYRLIMPVHNSESDQVVKQITLEINWWPHVACDAAPIFSSYQLTDTVYVDRQTGRAQASVALKSGPAAGFKAAPPGRSRRRLGALAVALADAPLRPGRCRSAGAKGIASGPLQAQAVTGPRRI